MRSDAEMLRVNLVPAARPKMHLSRKSGNLVLSILLLTLTSIVSPSATGAAPSKLYTSNEESGEVAVIDAVTGQVLQHIAVGKRPRGIKVSSDRKFLYVALSGSPNSGPGVDKSSQPAPDRNADGIGIIDLSDYKLSRVLPSGEDPEAFDLSPDDRTLYISNEDTGVLSVLDLHTGKIRSNVSVGREPEGVAVRPDGKVVYVACEGENEVVAIDAKSFIVLSRMRTGLRPRSIVFAEKGSVAFVTDERGSAVTVIDATKHRVTDTINIPYTSAISPARPMGSALSPDGKLVYVSNGRGGSVTIIDAAGRKVLRTIADVGARPWGIGVSRDGKHIYTANGPSDDVSVIDAANGRVEKRIRIEGHPWGLVVGD
jgi:YVTN family beta-propeller protein